MRIAEVKRTTKETDIFVRWNLDGAGKSDVETGIPFMDHMLDLFAKHGCFDLEVRAKGDLEIDCHHTMEDLGLAMGEALAKALGDKAGIVRYGSFLLPMDETLSMIALDLSGRPHLTYDFRPPAQWIKDLDTALFKEFFVALTNKSAATLHIRMISCGETHHGFESIFKGFGRALRQAVSADPRMPGVPSTKGSL